MAYAHNKILFSSKNELHNMDAFHKYNVKQHNSDTKKHAV